jgi:hypothetical protein
MFFMGTNINHRLVELVLKNIPSNIKPVSFLMESLDLSRESAYRRIRGEIPFSIEELANLSMHLNFSIDDVMNGIKKDRASFDFIPATSDSYSAFLMMLQRNYLHVKKLAEAQDSETIQALSRFSPICQVFHDQIFKFAYYKWLHQNKETSSNFTFSELILPPDLSIWQKKIQVETKKVTNNTMILDPNIFLNLIQDVTYYYQRNLINNDELATIKEEIADLIRVYETMARTGVLDPGANIYLYLSPLCVGADIGYSYYDSIHTAFFWIFTVNPIRIYNSEICSIQKKWLNSLKRQSTLISQSNEILQTEFFNTQRNHLNNYLCESGFVNK